MRVLVAGGAGFVGSHLCDRLHSDGHQIVVVDNYVTGRPENLAHLVDSPHIEVIQHDVTVPFQPSGRFDLVCHLASPASPSDFLRIPIEILEAGSAGTRNLLEIARRDQARFLLASTSEIYGDPLVHPQPESYWGNVDSIGPRSCYDEAKRYAEALTSAYRRVHGVRTVIARIFNTYGPRMRIDDGRVLVNFIVQALRGEHLTVHGDGSQTRSYCYVSDQVAGLLAIAEHGGEGPYNIGVPIEHTVRELAELVISVTGSVSTVVTVPLPPERTGDPQRRRPDITRITSDTDWRPEIDLRDGLDAMVRSVSQQLGLDGG